MGFFKNRNVYLLTTVAYMGSLLFGFRPPARQDGFASTKNANISSNAVSLPTAGCFFAAIASSFLNEKLGRRPTLMGFSVIFLVGALIQVASHHAIGQIYAGRVVAGLGIGGMSSVVSIYASENAPARQRGRIASLFQEFLVIRSTFAYWLDYGISLHIKPSTLQWRVPVAIQIIPVGFMLIGLFFLKKSPRWLIKNGRHQKATESLAWSRCAKIDNHEVLEELAEIRASCEEELRATEDVTWKECIQPVTGSGSFLPSASCSGNKSAARTRNIRNYAPRVFQTVGVSKTNASLFATGLYGTVKVVATAVFIAIGIDQFGRNKALIGVAFWMSSMMFIIGAVLATRPPNTKVPGVSHASIAIVVMIYLYVIGYSASWGPTPCVFVFEIFPTRLRTYGVDLAAATQWLFNFVITRVTPAVIANIGWKTFIIFGVFCLVMGAFVIFFVPETKRLTLEEIDVLFGNVDAVTRAQDVEIALHAEKKELELEHREGSTIEQTQTPKV